MWRAGVEGAGLAIMAATSANAVVRRGTPADALAAAEVWLRSRKAAMPAIPAPVHSDDDVRHHFRTVIEALRELDVHAPALEIEATGVSMAVVASAAKQCTIHWADGGTEPLDVHVEPVRAALLQVLERDWQAYVRRIDGMVAAPPPEASV